MSDLVERCGAVFSLDRTHRYRLWRAWDSRLPALCMVMLNPSTADETQNDPTVERCQRRAIAMGCGSIEVVNIFALRSTDPGALYAHPDPIGEQNDASIIMAVNIADSVLCGWGAHGSFLCRGARVEAMLRAHCQRKLHVLALNKDGSPKHPLYVPYQQKPIKWRMA